MFGGRELTRSEDLRSIIVEFEAQLVEQRAHREQARRLGVLNHDGYDKSILAAEAAVIDLCEQLFDIEYRDPYGDPVSIAERLERGLLSTRADRDFAIANGWAYRGEKKWLAQRELAWQDAVRHLRKAGFG
jgi:hypothetical protein